MKHTKLLLGALALGSIAAVGCDNPPATPDAATVADGGRDANTPAVDANVDANTTPTDGGTDAFAPDVGVPVTCAGYCTQILISCTGANSQYADMAACMTTCTNAGWTMGTQQDTAGNTLGCRVYHELAAVGSAGNAMTHCPHAGPLGGGPNGPCAPWRTEPATEGRPTTTEGAYVRVDRMGMPAVATALIGPGTTPATAVPGLKDAYNDSNPTGDTQFVSGVPLLTAIGAYHALLDDELVAIGLTPCSVTHGFPVPGAPAPIPACGVQNYTPVGTPAPIGQPGATVASLILPDTIRLDAATASGFPNGRRLEDDVIDPILSVLLLNLSPCAGSPTGTTCAAHTTMATCTPDTNCSWNGTSCGPAALSRAGVCATSTTSAACALNLGCTFVGTTCVPAPCEVLAAGTCGTQAGCSAATCGTGGARCTAGTLGGVPNFQPHMNDVANLTTFPYFAPLH